mgnify:CR=1 FL=1
MAKETFYSAYGQYTDKLEPGFKLKIDHHGSLLPQYTVAPPETVKPDEKAVESLLDFLDEDDIAPPPPVPTDNPTPQAPAKPQRPAAPPPGGQPKRPPAKPKIKPKRKNTMSR